MCGILLHSVVGQALSEVIHGAELRSAMRANYMQLSSNTHTSTASFSLARFAVFPSVFMSML